MKNSEYWERRRREEFEESKSRCYVCNKKIKNLKGAVKSDGKLYCSFECLNKDIIMKEGKNETENMRRNYTN